MEMRICLDRLLQKRKRTFYWLSKETGISHTTLWRLKKDRALGINFETLLKLCEALKCQPGDILKYEMKKKPALNRIVAKNQVGKSLKRWKR